MPRTAVVALGGNTITRNGQSGTYEEQSRNAEQVAKLGKELYKRLSVMGGHAASPTPRKQWQSATATPSAASAGFGASRSLSSLATMKPTWSLVARPAPTMAAPVTLSHAGGGFPTGVRASVSTRANTHTTPDSSASSTRTQSGLDAHQAEVAGGGASVRPPNR